VGIGGDFGRTLSPVGADDSQPLVDLAAEEAVLGMNLAAELFFQTTGRTERNATPCGLEHPALPSDPDIEIKISGGVGERNHRLALALKSGTGIYGICAIWGKGASFEAFDWPPRAVVPGISASSEWQAACHCVLLQSCWELGIQLHVSGAGPRQFRHTVSLGVLGLERSGTSQGFRRGGHAGQCDPSRAVRLAA